MSDCHVYKGYERLMLSPDEVYSSAEYEWRQVALKVKMLRGTRWPRNFIKPARYKPGRFAKVATTSHA